MVIYAFNDGTEIEMTDEESKQFDKAYALVIAHGATAMVWRDYAAVEHAELQRLRALVS